MIQLPTVSMLLYFESKTSLFSEKLQKVGTELELVTLRSNFSGTLNSSTCLLDTPNKSARFCSNILGDATLQSLKSEKTRKISLVSIPRHENLADLFLILPGQLQMS